MKTMLALQFDVYCGQQICDRLFVYRPGNGHTVVNKNEVFVCYEPGILNSELYCKNSNFMSSVETDDFQFVPANRIKQNHERVIFELNTKLCGKETVKFRRATHLDGYCISALFNLLKTSDVYRTHVLNFHYGVLSRNPVKFGLTEIYIYQEQPKKHILDYAGSKRFELLVHQRIELEHAMSWLSTLGGAFSALGDNQLHCAVVAGHISVQQFRIAMMLGDEMTLMRCLLYYGLSLVQRGYLKQARKVIEHEYKKAKMMPFIDSRILSMCLGIWARLKYEYEKRRHQKNHNKVREKIRRITIK